jgi:glucose-1-phosphate cytidylyltransferase
VILCGGRGTRLNGTAEALPKPLVEIGARPILWHVIQIYLAQGFERFVLLTGHRSELVRAFVADTPWPAQAAISCVDTGADTPTGGRILRARQAIGGGRFCVTYADGLADVELAALIAEHERSGAIGTVTLVRPELPFGIAEVRADGRVTRFIEKPQSRNWCNGGFFCFEPGLFDVLAPDCALEREPLARLAERGLLQAFRHEGFWACLDTYKDAAALNDIWATGAAPWATAQSSPESGCGGRCPTGGGSSATSRGTVTSR